MLDGIWLAAGVDIEVTEDFTEGNKTRDDDGSIDGTFDGSALGTPDGMKIGTIESVPEGGYTGIW